ncbi:MAG: hypothetical protein SPK03_05775, partial [Alloprevotella sp.]|nr:hypothetical protein [Alloprevotella sp.]
ADFAFPKQKCRIGLHKTAICPYKTEKERSVLGQHLHFVVSSPPFPNIFTMQKREHSQNAQTKDIQKHRHQ